MGDQKENQSNKELSMEDLQMQLELLTNAKNELQEKLTQSNLELSESRKNETASINRAMKVHEQNELMKSSSELVELQARLDYDMKIATMYATFKKVDPITAYITIKAGEEMGLKPITSMNMLYTVNGQTKAHGDKMVGYVISKGYKVDYLNEVDDKEVTVAIFKLDDNGKEVERYEETAKITDKIIQISLAKKGSVAEFAPKNKLRFHGVRMICSFYLAHLFMGVSDEFTNDYKEFKQGQVTKNEDGTITVDAAHVEILDEHHEAIMNFENEDELDDYYADNKKAITKNIKLLSLYGKRKGEFQSQVNQEDNGE